MKKLSELYMDARKALSIREDIQTASLIARDILCFSSGKTKEALLMQLESYATDAVQTKMEHAVARAMAGEPLAYVINQWDFYGMTLYITPAVLIPRDDTCAVTELAIKQALFLEASPRILDLCTGSGCIGLAIANRVKDARVTLADISQDAMQVAKRNVAEQKLSGRVNCVRADAMDEPAPFLGKFDMIVSNPPYVTAEEMKELPASVRNFEPHLALYGGEDGLAFYKSIVKKYSKCLKPGGYLCFEFGMGQGDDVCEILKKNGYTILERSRDYNGRERAVIAQLGRKDV